MTPSKKECHALLGSDNLTFLGAICNGSVVLLVRQNQSGGQKDVNKNKLMAPFDDAVVYGDILLTKSGENGEAQNYTLDDYNNYNPDVDENVEEEEEEEEEFNSDEEDDEEDMNEHMADEEDEEDEEDDDFLDQLTEKIMEGYYSSTPTINIIVNQSSTYKFVILFFVTNFYAYTF